MLSVTALVILMDMDSPQSGAFLHIPEELTMSTNMNNICFIFYTVFCHLSCSQNENIAHKCQAGSSVIMLNESFAKTIYFI